MLPQWQRFFSGFSLAKNKIGLERKILNSVSLFMGLLGILYATWSPEKTIGLVFPSHVVYARAIYYFLFFASTVAILGTIGFFHTKKTSLLIQLKKTLVAFFPFILSISIGMYSSHHVSWIFFLIVGIYFFIVGCFFVVVRHADRTGEQLTSTAMPRPNRRQWIFVFIVMMLQFSFGFHQLGKQTLVDEPLWLFGRIEKYWDNIAERSWKDTQINDKPGISVAFISGAGLLLENPDDWQSKKTPLKEKFYKVMRLPIFFFCVLMTPVWFLILRKLLGDTVALVSLTLISLHPLLLGISRMVNPDSLFWIFVPLAIVSYLSFLQTRHRYSLYTSGIFLGSALLTKYVANILFVYFFALIFLAIIIRDWENRDAWKKYLKDNIIDYAVLVFIALSVFYLFLPAVWVKPKILLQSTIYSQAFSTTWPYFFALLVLVVTDTFLLKNAILSFPLEFLRRWKRWFVHFILGVFLLCVFVTLVNTFLDMRWVDFESIVSSPKSSHNMAGFFGMFLSNFYPLFFGISPLLLFLTILGIVNARNAQNKDIPVVAFTIFIVLYYLGTSFMEVGATVRYQIVLFPIFLIIAAKGLENIMPILKNKRSPLLLPTFFLVASSLTLLSIQPFYFSYASSILPQQFVLNPKDMGDGSFQAATYLNSLPGAENLSVWADKDGVCAVFVGRCTSALDFKRYVQSSSKFDYYVVSRGRMTKNTRAITQKLQYNPDYLIRFDKLYQFKKPEYSISLGNRASNYIKIINAKDIDISHTPDPTKPQI